MSSGVARIRTGSFEGTGAILNVDVPGFRPRVVEIYNLSGLAKLVYTDKMADDSGIKTVTAGTISAITSGGVTLRTNGFALGADTDINVSGEICHWVAYE